MARPPRRELVLDQARTLSPTVRELVFRTVDGGSFEPVPGQWVTLYLTVAGGQIHRSYSIAAPFDPAAPDRVEIAVTFVEGGPASGALHAMTRGDRVGAQGPLGVFTLARIPREAPVLFVGTGTGVAPLRAMLLAELLRSPTDGPRLTLLFGGRTPRDLLYREQFEALAATHPRFRYVPTLSRADDDWPGLKGYVQTHFAAHCSDGDTHVLICGLSTMVRDSRRTLKEDFGYDRKRIHTERYD